MKSNSIYLDNVNYETENVLFYQKKYELNNDEILNLFMNELDKWSRDQPFGSIPNFEVNDSGSLELNEFKNIFLTNVKNSLKDKSIIVKGRIYKEKINDFYKYDRNNTIIYINLNDFLNNIYWINSIKLKNKKINIVFLMDESKQLSTPFLNFSLIGKELANIELSSDTQKEIKFLRNIGFDFYNSANLIRFDDTFLTSINVVNLKIYTQNIIDKLLLLISEDYDDHYSLSGMKIVDIYKNWDDFNQIKLTIADVEKIYSMWQFLFDETRFNDKKMFLNKSITLYLGTKSNYVGFVRDFSNIIAQVEKLFESYVEHSVEIFVNQESKMIEIYTEAAKTINDSIKNITQKVRDVFLAFMGVFLITFLEKNNSILNYSIINLALIMYFIYGIINLISIYSIYKQNKIELDNFEHMVEKINKQISIDIDDQYKTEYVIKSERQFMRIYWISFIFIALVSIGMMVLFLIHRNPNWKFSEFILPIIKCIIGYNA